MNRRILLTLGLLVCAADAARAQIIQGPIRSREPVAWVSLGIGWLDQQGLRDPDSGAIWDFGSAPQWRATLEAPLGRGASIGVAGTTARVPLIYAGSLTGPNSCARCDADANVSQIMGQLHIGGGAGFHQVIEISAGMTLFSNFRASDGTRLGDGKTVSDFSFGIGYGFGYSFSDRTRIALLQEYGLVLHKRQPGQSNNTAQQRTTRLGLRFGLGER